MPSAAEWQDANLKAVFDERAERAPDAIDRSDACLVHPEDTEAAGRAYGHWVAALERYLLKLHGIPWVDCPLHCGREATARVACCSGCRNGEGREFRHLWQGNDACGCEAGIPGRDGVTMFCSRGTVDDPTRRCDGVEGGSRRPDATV